MKRAQLVMLMLAAAPLLARGASAPEPRRVKAKVAGSDCTAPAPRPLLDKSAYAGYSFKFGPENTATEQASSGTLHLEIGTAGCYDGVEHSFVFVDANPLSPYDDRDHWLLFASGQIKALKLFRRAQDDVKDLLEFLANAKIATTRKNASEIRLEVCRDGSPSTEDGCSFKSGGGYRFAVRALDKNKIQVYVSRYVAL